MYTQRMTAEELNAQYKADIESSMPFCTRKIEENRRKLVKATKFPVIFYEEWVSPRNNKYLIQFRCDEKRFITQKQKVEFDIWHLAKIDTPAGIYYMDASERMYGMHSYSASGINRSPIKIYSAHMFKRYGERFGIMKGYRNIQRQFFCRWGQSYTTACNGDIFPSHGGEAEVLTISKEGLLFGTYEDNIIRYNTYLSYNEKLTAKQKEYINKMAEFHLELKDIYENDEKYSLEKRTIEIHQKIKIR